MYELYMVGTDDTGRVYPRVHFMGTTCLQSFVNCYRQRYPQVVHVNVDIALPTVDFTAAIWGE